MRVAITIHYGATSRNMTGHVGSRTDSYILQGDKLTSADFAGKVVVAHWYSISAIDVLAPKTSAAVAVIGNSITDGYGLSGGLNNRWTDALSESLLKNSSTQDVGVLNLGIGATTVLGGGKTTGESRFQRDVLEQSGVAWVILFYGVNDIGGNASATNIIAGLKRMATSAKARGMKVYGATITPFGGNSYYSVAHESARRDVNAWIRSGGDASLDGLIDLDKAIRNTSDTTKLKTEYSNDWLHPNAAGYKALGQSVDLKLFELPNVGIDRDRSATGYALKRGYRGPKETKMLIPFEIPSESHVSLKVYSVQGKEITELAGRDFAPGLHTLEFDTKGLGNGVYMYSIQAGGFSASRKVYVP